MFNITGGQGEGRYENPAYAMMAGRVFLIPEGHGHLVVLAGNIGNDRTAATIAAPEFEPGTFSPGYLSVREVRIEGHLTSLY